MRTGSFSLVLVKRFMSPCNYQSLATDESVQHSQPFLLKHATRITDAEQLHESALSLVQIVGDVTVDCEDTDWVDASILQILIALKSSLRNEGRALRFTNVSSSLASTWGLAGFDLNLEQSS